jgi:hypothetical protein
MKKITKIILPLGIIGLMSGCCYKEPAQPQVQTNPCCCTQTCTQPVKKVVQTCENCKPVVKQNQKQSQIININVKVNAQKDKSIECKLSEDAPVTPYIDYY